MRVPRVFVDVPLAAGATVTLPPDSAHYLKRVLRLPLGATLTLFNGQTTEFDGTLRALSSAGAEVELGTAREAGTESPLHTWLVQGLARGQRMDYCVQKATELGVQRISVVAAERSVVRLSGKRASSRLAHWQSIAASAAEQSFRTNVPGIELAGSLDAWLATASGVDLALLDPDGQRLADWRAPGAGLALLIGPEGGWSDGERDAALAAGASAWRMGPRLMRTETAGVIALALAQSRWGDLN